MYSQQKDLHTCRYIHKGMFCFRYRFRFMITNFGLMYILESSKKLVKKKHCKFEKKKARNEILEIRNI